MPLRAAAAVLALALFLACAQPRPLLSPEQLKAAIRSTRAPLVVIFWADWSRPSLELLPTAAELAREYEGEGVVFYTVSLGRPEHRDARRVLNSFPAGARHFVLEEDPSVSLIRFGLADVPAALIYAPGGDLQRSLGAGGDTPLAPADLVDAVETVLAAP